MLYMSSESTQEFFVPAWVDLFCFFGTTHAKNGRPFRYQERAALTECVAKPLRCRFMGRVGPLRHVKCLIPDAAIGRHGAAVVGDTTVKIRSGSFTPCIYQSFLGQTLTWIRDPWIWRVGAGSMDRGKCPRNMAPVPPDSATDRADSSLKRDLSLIHAP